MSRDIKLLSIGFIAGMIVMFLCMKFISCSSPITPAKTETKIVYDTNTVIRYLTDLEKDTAKIKWFEKIVKQYLPAETIYIQKVDTVFKEIVKKFDVMLRVEKSGTDLIITAFNEQLGVLKERHYKIEGDNFVAISKTDDVDVKSSKFDFKGINLFYQAGIQTDSLLNRRGFNNLQHVVGAEGEVAYKNKLTLGLSQEYDITNKTLWTKAKLKYYLFR